MAISGVGPRGLMEYAKKKKPGTAADQANAIENTVLGAGQGTSAQPPRTVEEVGRQHDREAGQAVLDRAKFQPQSAATVTQTVQANYGYGIADTPRIKAMEKQGKTVADIVKALGLKPKAK